MKLITLLALLSIAGCGDLPQDSGVQGDSKVSTSGSFFTFSQNYGICNDTICTGESLIIGDIAGNPYESVVVNIQTLGDIHNGLPFINFTMYHNLSHTYSVDFGNGSIRYFNNSGNVVIDWIPNTTYEVIITYE